MYTAKFKYVDIDGKKQIVKTKKFLSKTLAIKWINSMKKKSTVFVAEIQGKHYYYCVM